MTTFNLVTEIERLSNSERIEILEAVIKLLKRDNDTLKLQTAGKELYNDYKNDSELTSFTSLDLESFYEPR